MYQISNHHHHHHHYIIITAILPVLRWCGSWSAVRALTD